MNPASTTNNPSDLLTLPLEIREEIYSNLLLPEHVYTSSATPDTYSLYRNRNPPPTYADARIYLPSRLSSGVLQVCKQLREECLQFYARRLNSQHLAKIADIKPLGDTSSNEVASRYNRSNDDAIERFHDSETVRVTLEVLTEVRGNTGFSIPDRQFASPRFLGLTPLLCGLKKIKFIVWAGFSWWSGESMRPVSTGMTKRARMRRLFSDQTDQVQESSVREVSSQPPRPNHLSTALDTLLHRLPQIEELDIDLLVYILDYTHWDLPEENKWQGISSWLDGPICPTEGKRLKRVGRRIVVIYPSIPIKSVTVLRQQDLLQGEEDTVSVKRGFRGLPDDWEESDTYEEPPYTHAYQRPT